MMQHKNTIIASLCLVITVVFSFYIFDIMEQREGPKERTVMIFYLLTIVGLIFSVLSFKAEEPKKILKWLIGVGNFIMMMIATWSYIMAKVIKAALEG